MKYILLLVIVIFSGCELWIGDIDHYTNHSDYDPVYKMEIPDYSNMTNADIFRNLLWFVYMNIHHFSENLDYWQTPKETYLTNLGDCEDKAIYFMYLYRQITDNKCELWIIRNFTNNKLHAIAVYNDLFFGFDQEQYYDDNGNMDIIDIYDYGTALYYAEYLK